VIVPPKLAQGDRVWVVAPSGPFERTLVLRGLGFLSERYDVRFGEGIFSRQGYLAGSDDRRFAELTLALSDPETKAVLAARGGYGLARIVSALDVARLRDHPVWIAGFSDITALHVEAQRAGVASLHADNVAGLGRGDLPARERFVAALEDPHAERSIGGLDVWRGGVVTGPLTGGNLTLLFTAAASGRLHVPRGAVLFIEDIGEAPYRVDRMLTALLTSGALDAVAGVLVGDFTDAPPGRHGVPVEDVLRERLGLLQVPVLAGFPAGHGAVNVPMHLGLPARVDGDTGSVVLCPRPLGRQEPALAPVPATT
jgi:muramoyltetrapeptide carboxypeptidase